MGEVVAVAIDHISKSVIFGGGYEKSVNSVSFAETPRLLDARALKPMPRILRIFWQVPWSDHV
jgi:hypothetical protein